MSDLRLFGNGEFAIEVIPAADTFTVSAAGVARALGFRDAYRMVETVPEDQKGYTLAGTPGGEQRVWFLTEPGLYRVIGQRQTSRVKSPEVRAAVERFQHWVFGEVLPAIRRNGEYRQASIGEPPSQVEALRRWADEIERSAALAARVDELVPIAAQAEFHRAADGLVAVADFANKVKAWAKREHDVKVLHAEVWDFLGQLGLIVRGNTIRNNQPTAFATGRDFVRGKETEYTDGEGVTHTSVSPRLTPAGEGWAWDRAIRRIVEHGSLRPTTDLERTSR